MDSHKIRFAFAVNNSNGFGSENFCNADKFSIYQLINEDFIFIKEIENNFNVPEEGGSINNGNEIIELLKSHDISVLVASIYGKNIQMVNSHFIPVIVSSETPDEVITVIKKHIKWIKDEMGNRPPEFKLFTINKGILKTTIKKSVQKG